jgi:hypothetical protein
MNARHLTSMLMFALLATGASAEDPVLSEFQADQVCRFPNGKTQLVYRVMAAPDKVRLEHKGKHPDLVTLQRRDLGVVWTLVPSTHRYTEEKLSADGFASALRIAGPVVADETLDAEMINGMACEKHRIEVPTVSQGKTGTAEAVVWTCPQLPYPVRIQRPDGNVSELLNIIGGSQPEGVFEVPEDYVKVDGIMAALSAPPVAPNNAMPPDPKGQRPASFNVKSYKWKFGVR